MDSSPFPSPPARWRALLALLAVVSFACSPGATDAASSRTPPSASPSVGVPPTTSLEEPEGTDSGHTGEDVEREVVTLTDKAARSTARGRVPPYVQIAEAGVEGDVRTLTFRVVLAGRVPAQVGSAETARLTVGVLAEDGTRYSLYAQASQDGWAAYAVGGEEGPYPGDLEVSGRRIVFVMPRSYFGTLPSFRWLVNVAYSKGNAYGFDALPEDGYARFP